MDRYQLAEFGRDTLRKMLTRMRQEEQRIAKIIDVKGINDKFAKEYRARAKAKDIRSNKNRIINEYMRIQRNISAVGRDGEKMIQADEQLEDFLNKRGISNTLQTRRKFGEFMDNYRASVIGKIAPSEDALDFFEQFGENADINDFVELYQSTIGG